MIYLNGKIVCPQDAKIETNDRGFLLSDGLFETMRAYNGKVFLLKEHWQRLIKSADFLEIPVPISYSDLEKIIFEVLDKNDLGQKDASIRLTVTRGTGPRGLLPPVEAKPTVMVAAFLYAAHVTQPAKTFITSIRRNEFSPLANIKSLNYLDNILARKEAVKNGADEGILLNTSGRVAEACAANIFVVTTNGDVITPKIEEGVLPGITRQLVIELCKELGISISETLVTQEMILEAKEIFLTNSLTEIQPVLSINNKVVAEKVGDITEKLQEAYQAAIKNHLYKSSLDGGSSPKLFSNNNNVIRTTSGELPKDPSTLKL